MKGLGTTDQWPSILERMVIRQEYSSKEEKSFAEDSRSLLRRDTTKRGRIFSYLDEGNSIELTSKEFKGETSQFPEKAMREITFFFDFNRVAFPVGLSKESMKRIRTLLDRQGSHLSPANKVRLESHLRHYEGRRL